MRGSLLQTPQKDQTSANRRQKSNPYPKRNLRKVVKKSLNPEFTSVLEEDRADLESSEEVPLISVDNPFSESAANIISLPCPLDTPASETVAVSDLTSPSSVMTNRSFDALNNKYEIPGIDSFKIIDSIEAEMVINSLREARVHVLKSKGLGHSRNLLDALVNVIIEEFSEGEYEKKGWLSKLLSRNASLVLVAFMLWSLAIVVLFFSLGSMGLPNGQTPT